MHFMKLLRNIFLLFNIIFWGISVHAQNIPEKGVGQWEKLPFGQVRMLSCSTGRQNRNIIVGGLQVQLDDGWVLDRPNLSPLSPEGVISYPIRPNPIKTQKYTGSFLIPVIYPHQPNQKDLNFGVQGNLKACANQNCWDIPIKINLSLDENESKYTSYCAYIMDELKKTPIPAFDMGQGQWMNDHQSLLSFKIPRVNQAFLQNENGLDFRILQTRFSKDEVEFKVSYTPQWPNKTIRDWILITNQGVFRVPIILDEKTFPKKEIEKPWWTFFFGSFFFFICSPFFILLGTSFKRNKKQLRQQCIKAIIVSAITITLSCLWMRFFDYNEVIQSIATPVIWIILGITLILTPRNAEWAGALFILWPKPFLHDMLDYFPLYAIIPWFIIGHIVPFFIMYKYAEFWGKKGRAGLKKDFFFQNLFFLLPTICLLGWSVFSYTTDISYNNIPHIDKNRINVICEKTECMNWENLNSNIRFINPQSSFGKELLNHHETKGTTVIFNDEGNETVLTDTTVKKFKRYLIGLQNYRARYTPIDPPTHSGDAPHGPSPNAK